jgi:membrane protease YdiL (CAAX protease family)
MHNSIRTKQYWIKLLPVIVWLVLDLVFSSSFDKDARVYFSLIYFLGIAIYLFLWREWRFSEWRIALNMGKAFWIPVLLTAFGMALMFGVGIGITMLFPNINDGIGVYAINNWRALIAFAFVTIFLPPIAEEAFFRKAIIAFDSKVILVTSVIISIFLYASEHSLRPLGFFQACLWAVPLSIAYVKTKNVYVSMTAHFICNFVMNGIGVIVIATRL